MLDKEQRIKEIKERHAKATPGPWKYETDGDCGDGGDCWEAPYLLYTTKETKEVGWFSEPRTVPKAIANLAEEGCSFEDAAFLAHSWEDIQFLLEENRQLRAQLAGVEVEVERV